jgi:hypothetical protein
MTGQDRIVAGITLTHALLGMAWTFWLALSTGVTDTRFVYDVVLASGGIVAGAGWLRGRSWAGFVAFAYYLVQLVRMATPGYAWPFMLGFNVNIGFAWAAGHQLAINLFALIMLIWASRRALVADRPRGRG